MNDIIRMAREAGLFHFYDSEGHCTGVTDAALIDADKERNDKRLVEILAPFAALVAAAEREACAALVDENAMGCENPIYRSLLQANAEAIRERGQT
jgi:hypothetical protein